MLEGRRVEVIEVYFNKPRIDIILRLSLLQMLPQARPQMLLPLQLLLPLLLTYLQPLVTLAQAWVRKAPQCYNA